MSKTVPSALLTHYALGTTTVAHALWIKREDDLIYRFTEHDSDDTVTGVSVDLNGTYTSDPGLTVTDVAIAAGVDVGNLEITTLHDGSIFTTADLLSDRWRNAQFQLFRYNHQQDPVTAIEEVLAGTFGEIELRRNTIVIELHDLRRYLNTPVGNQSSKTCRYRLGDDKCMKDISGPPWTMPFTVSSVSSANQIFRDNARLEADDWFGEGEVRWLSGNNADTASKVKTYAANGTFTLALKTAYPIQVGDTGTAIVGCRKRRTEDCFTKFDNVLNFGAEPDRRGTDDLTKDVTAANLADAVLDALI